MTTLPHLHVYSRLGVSKIQGVGVFAILAIPAGTMVFAGDEADLIWIKKADIQSLTPAQQKLYYDFGLQRGDLIGCPTSFNNLTPGWFVNHNENDPNLAYDLKECHFYAIRDIAVGEELTASYHLYADNLI